MPFTVEIPEDHTLQLRFARRLSLQEFAEFCARHPELHVEREPDGQINVMSPVHLLSGRFESIVNFYLSLYLRENRLGEAYSASTGFTLPDGSVRSADAAFVSNQQLERLSLAEQRSFAKVVPEFVIEIRSDTDRIGQLQTKMKDTWIGNGVRLAWLIDPKNEVTYINRIDGSEQVVAGFDKQLSGEDVLPGFVFDLKVLNV
jgi:Uma2 family endonuclease